MLKKVLASIATIAASVSVAMAAVNINTATQAELEGLPGVGPTKAKAIIEYRTKNGNFKVVEDIKSVKGFGEKTFGKLKAELSVEGPTNASAGGAKIAAGTAK